MVARGAVVLLLAAILNVPAAVAATGTQPFTTTGEHPFVVPAGVTSVQVMLVGGNGAAKSSRGGTPATVTATLAVVPGQTLYVEVAGDGNDYLGGYGGGGDGAGGGLAPYAGGGGGASDVRTCPASGSGCATLTSRLVVAGGGGGSGATFSGGGPGGPGGPADLAGYDGYPFQSVRPGAGGAPGTRSAGGAGGAGGPNPGGSGGAAGIAGGSGIQGLGGTGKDSGGGGGGGGIFGGGGGGGGSTFYTGNTVMPFDSGGGGGGGGGSSGVPAGATGVSGFMLIPTAVGAQPQVVFTWTLPSPLVVTGGASSVTARSATLSGTVNPNGLNVTDCHFVVSPGGTNVPCAQQVGAGTTPQPVSASVGGLSPSTGYSVTLMATSGAGMGSGSAVGFMTAATPTTSMPPVLTGFGVTSKVHRRSSKKPAKVTFTLSQPASVSLTFERVLSGLRSAGRCVAPVSKLRRTHAKPCARYRPVPGSLTVSGRAGGNTVRFAGGLDHGVRLAVGRYRVRGVATNSVGQRSTTLRASFAVVQ